MKNENSSIEYINPCYEILTPQEEMNTFIKRLERIGRTCYKSFDRISSDSADKFVSNIVKLGHESILEHCSITVKFTISRACSHQLVRHRIASFTQESQRYVDYSKNTIKIVLPHDLKDNEFLKSCIYDSIKTYNQLRTMKIKPEDARYILPNCVATELIVTCNLREWRHIIKLRTTKGAQQEIRELMSNLLVHFRQAIPIVFDDL